MTLPTRPDDVDEPRPQPQWWWEVATERARQASAHLQAAVTQSLRSRQPRLVEAVGVYRAKGLVAVTADTVIVAVDDELETRTNEVRADQISGVTQKSPRVISVRFEETDLELRVSDDALQIALVALRAPMSLSPPERVRHAVAPPSGPLATGRLVSDDFAQPDRRAPLQARRSATSIGMGSRGAHVKDAPERVPTSVSAESDPTPSSPPTDAPAAPEWEYVRNPDGVWRRSPVSAGSPVGSGVEAGDERVQ